MPDPVLPSKKVEEKKPSSLLNLLHIALDTYDDIFSDFDPSGYEHRILSDDFMKEMQKRYVENRKGDIEIRFSIPAVMRSGRIESLIKKRLKEYFQIQIKELDMEIGKRKGAGGVYFAVGFVVLLLTYYSSDIFPASHSAQVLGTLLTPLGWFGMWEGLSLLVQAPIKYEEQKKFYSKFSKANYVFINEEDFLKELSESESADLAKAETKEAKTEQKKA
ncbi:MAG: hypothetical protein PHS02_03445 [Candidatus ainarchaeum sp.]|nr:hypothetical protein [Candidatus ainarchaeum sp.]